MKTSLLRAAVATTLFASALIASAGSADAATLTSASLTMSDPRPSQTANYDFVVSNQTTATSLQCVTIQFNTAADGTGSVPPSFNVSAATWSGNFHGGLATWTRAHTAGLAKITGSAQTPPAGTGRTITLTGVTNSSTVDTTYYAIIKTFSNNTCTTEVDTATIAYVYTAGTQMTMSIRPSMTFTVANRATACNGETGYINNSAGNSTQLPLGSPAPGASVSTAQTLTATSNASAGDGLGGVIVYLRGLYATGNLRSSSHQFQDAAVAYDGVGGPLGSGERFGYTVIDPNYFLEEGNFVALDSTPRTVLGQYAVNGASQTGCVGYQVQTATSTPAGDYAATLIYTAVPNF